MSTGVLQQGSKDECETDAQVNIYGLYETVGVGQRSACTHHESSHRQNCGHSWRTDHSAGQIKMFCVQLHHDTFTIHRWMHGSTIGCARLELEAWSSSIPDASSFINTVYKKVKAKTLTDTRPSWHWRLADPERDPGQNHQQNGRNVRLQDKEQYVSTQCKM